MNRVLRYLELLLFAGAMAAFGWAAGSYLGAAREQANWASELERLTEQPRVAVAAPQRDSSRRAAPARGSLIGRLEVPRLGVSVITRRRRRQNPAERRRARSRRVTGSTGQRRVRGIATRSSESSAKFVKGIVVVTTPRRGAKCVVRRRARIVKPTDVSVLDRTTDAVLTLVTCYPFSYIGPAPQGSLSVPRWRKTGLLPASRAPRSKLAGVADLMFPSGFRLPDATTLGPVRGAGSDLERSLDYYQRVLGLAIVSRDPDVAALAPHDADAPLVWLHARPREPPTGLLGLYHFAILV